MVTIIYSRRARKWNMNMWILQPPCVCQRHAVFFVSFLCLLGPSTRNFVDIGQELFVWEPTKGTASKHHFHLLYSVQLCLHLDAVLCNCSQMESSCLNWTKFRELQAKTHTDIEKKNHRLLWHPGDILWRFHCDVFHFLARRLYDAHLGARHFWRALASTAENWREKSKKSRFQ